MTAFAINGTATSIQPYTQKWRAIPIGISHSKRQLLSGNWEIDLAFDSASVTFMREWADAASSGSKNLTVLDQYQLGWTNLSSVQLEMVEYPVIESGMSGPWTMIVRGASPSS